MKIRIDGSACYMDDEPDENGVYHGEWKHSEVPVSAVWSDEDCKWVEWHPPTMIERLEEYERPVRERAEELEIKYGEATHSALQAALYGAEIVSAEAMFNDGWEAIGWIEDEFFTWGNPEPVRQDYYLAWPDGDFGRRFTVTATSDTISYEWLAVIFGKPQKKDYGRARDFRAARRRYARWKKGKP